MKRTSWPNLLNFDLEIEETWVIWRKEGRERERERKRWINAGRLHLWRCGEEGYFYSHNCPALSFHCYSSNPWLHPSMDPWSYFFRLLCPTWIYSTLLYLYKFIQLFGLFRLHLIQDGRCPEIMEAHVLGGWKNWVFKIKIKLYLPENKKQMGLNGFFSLKTLGGTQKEIFKRVLF